jgi:protein-S-isoprenylcysteine O-methyltransferase Ste14
MMMLRACLAFVALPLMVAGVVPWLLSRVPGHALFAARWGILPPIVGALIVLSAVVSFYRRGRGTLAPWDPPRELVVRDLYRFNRNPMYVGVVLVLIGWALWTGSIWLYGYVCAVAAVFHLRVVLYEEKEMERLFGPQWAKYRAAVPRWGVRLRRAADDF